MHSVMRATHTDCVQVVSANAYTSVSIHSSLLSRGLGGTVVCKPGKKSDNRISHIHMFDIFTV